MNAIVFSVATLKELDRSMQRAVIAAGLAAGLYDVQQAAGYLAECSDELAARLAKQYVPAGEAHAG